MIDDKKIWAVEWNPKDKTSHIQTLRETIEGNLRFILNNEGNTNYLLVAVAESAKEADQLCDEIEKRFR